MWGLFKRNKVENLIIVEPRFGFDNVEWIKPNYSAPKYTMSVTAKGIVMHESVANMLDIKYGHHIEVGFSGEHIILKVNRASQEGFKVRPERLGSDKMTITSQVMASNFLDRGIERGQYSIESISKSRFSLKKVETPQ